MDIHALPIILSLDTSQPYRESVLLLRLSPITKYSPGGITVLV